MIGFKGERGYSAYEIAVQNGFVGSEQSWLAQLGTSNAYGQNATTVTTTTKNQKELVLPDEYNSNSILTIYIDGLKLNEDMYSIDSTNKKVILTNPIENIGTKVEISITTMTTTNLPITTEVNELSTDKTSPSSKCVYNVKKDLEGKIEESNLPVGGTNGQVLIKASDKDNDVVWAKRNREIVVVDNLKGTSGEEALSAKQGKILNEKVSKKILWESNVVENLNFPQQTITLTSDDYDYLIILSFRNPSGQTKTVSTIVEKEAGTQRDLMTEIIYSDYFGGTVRSFNREVTIKNNMVTFGECFINGEISNTTLVPYKIIGCKY